MPRRPERPKGRIGSFARRPAGSEQRPDADGWIAVGEIIGTFGIKGDLKVRLLTDFPERFARTPTLYLGDERAPRASTNAREHKNMVLLHLAGVETPEEGDRLRGTMLYVPEGEISALPPDQFYLHDVVGMRVLHVNGTELGTVVDVLPTGGNDVYVVHGADGRESMLPAVKEFIRAMDVSARTITVDPIPGLFDDDADEVPQ